MSDLHATMLAPVQKAADLQQAELCFLFYALVDAKKGCRTSARYTVPGTCAFLRFGGHMVVAEPFSWSK